MCVLFGWGFFCLFVLYFASLPGHISVLRAHKIQQSGVFIVLHQCQEIMMATCYKLNSSDINILFMFSFLLLQKLDIGVKFF